MASPRKRPTKRRPHTKLPDKIREELPLRALQIPRKTNFSGLETKSYLARIASCLEVDYPEEPELKNRYWYDSLEEQFSKLGQANFAANWFDTSGFDTSGFDSKQIPELGKAFEEVDLNNLYHFSLLCSYTERYGVPEGKWLKQACIDRANDSLYNLTEGNLLFYQLLTRTAYSGWGEELFSRTDTKVKQSKLPDGNFKMSKIQNAGHTSGGVNNRDYQKFNEFKHQVLEQALLKKTIHKSYNFGSYDIKLVFRRLTDEDIIMSRYKSKLNIILPLWRKLVNI